jgi:hypothetical protein
MDFTRPFLPTATARFGAMFPPCLLGRKRPDSENSNILPLSKPHHAAALRLILKLAAFNLCTLIVRSYNGAAFYTSYMFHFPQACRVCCSDSTGLVYVSFTAGLVILTKRIRASLLITESSTNFSKNIFLYWLDAL